MKAAVYYQNGGPEVFRYEDVATPVPNDYEVLLKIEAISIEGGDTLNRLGGDLLSTPHVVGYQAAGVIEAVGAAVTKFHVGQRVVTTGTHGSHAEYRVAGESFCWLIPDGLDTKIAACVPIAFGTAHDSLFAFGHLTAGETVLFHAGASGTGLAGIQLAKRAGATVIATASSDKRLERLKEYGLDHGINYVRDDFVAATRELTGGRGADLVVDSVGGPNLQKSLAALAYRGRCVNFGDAGRNGSLPLDVSGLRGNNQSLTGYFLGAELFFGTRAHDVITGLLKDVASGELKVVIDSTYPLAEAAAAHERIEGREAFGRVVLIP